MHFPSSDLPTLGFPPVAPWEMHGQAERPSVAGLHHVRHVWILHRTQKLRWNNSNQYRTYQTHPNFIFGVPYEIEGVYEHLASKWLRIWGFLMWIVG